MITTLLRCLTLLGLLTSLPLPAEPPSPLVKDQPAHPANLKAHVDPATGRIVPPPAAQPNPNPNPAPAPASPGRNSLVETPVPVRGGGFRVDLEGRFRCTSVACIGADGKVTTRCTSTGHHHLETAPSPVVSPSSTP